MMMLSGGVITLKLLFKANEKGKQSSSIEIPNKESGSNSTRSGVRVRIQLVKQDATNFNLVNEAKG